MRDPDRYAKWRRKTVKMFRSWDVPLPSEDELQDQFEASRSPTGLFWEKLTDMANANLERAGVEPYGRRRQGGG